jgi:hypothetical protein
MRSKTFQAGIESNDNILSADPVIFTKKPGSIFVHVGWIVILSVLYWIIFLIPLPPQYKRWGVFLIDELMLLIVLALVFIIFRYPGGEPDIFVLD